MRAVNVRSSATGDVGDVVDMQMNGPERLDDVDVDGADGQRVRVVVGRADVVGHRRRSADHAELQAVHLPARREVGDRQDDDIAEAVARMEDEEQALPPVLVVRRHVGQRLGDLVDEVLVHRGQPDHGASASSRSAARSSTSSMPTASRRSVGGRCV